MHSPPGSCRQLLALHLEHAALLLHAMQLCYATSNACDYTLPIHWGPVLQQSLQHGLSLLARWAVQSSRRRELQQAEHAADQALIHSAVAWLLDVVLHTAGWSTSPAMTSASVLFLGAAFSGVCTTRIWGMGAPLQVCMDYAVRMCSASVYVTLASVSL